eukprot:TRINITY_DN1365_c0_g2_i1.p1 TRINITY_DN1365_c0_g2~~TRINITY_DN1365_c0_g2_i1.p1  ORF type:complete len:132 (-),score=14.59 TRINITY_DN1365_c0_g2_i1:235-630(-)
MITVAGDGRRRSKEAAQVTSGDQLEYMDHTTGRQETIEVLAVRSALQTLSMHAPVTASGLIVVNGVTASNYAVLGSTKSLKHIAVHASFFVLRFVCSFGVMARTFLPFSLALMSDLKFSTTQLQLLPEVSF